MICGVLHWLHDAREREKAEAEAKAAEAAAGGGDEDDMPNWMREFASQEEEKLRKHAEAQRKAQIAKAKARLLPGGKRPTAERTSGAHIDDPEAEFLLDEWDGTEEASAGKGPGSRKRHALLSDSEDSDAEPDVTLGEAAPLEPPRKMQIIFCSRTHSQLTQFVGELHRTPFADAMSLVALGSRRALCINEDVLRLRSPGLINERCLELQKPASSKKKSTDADGKSVRSKATSARCAFLAAGSKAADTMRDMVLAHPMDIEELAVLGKRRSICPYYASRRAAPEADIVLAPYSALLVAETREALGLRVEGNVIIVDEAHNLGKGGYDSTLPVVGRACFVFSAA